MDGCLLIISNIRAAARRALLLSGAYVDNRPIVIVVSMIAVKVLSKKENTYKDQ